MKDKYEKMYNIKIYKKPKKHKFGIDFIHHYVENDSIYNFKEGDYIVARCGRDSKNIGLIHIGKCYYNDTFWLVKYNHKGYYKNIHPSVILYYCNFSEYYRNIDKFIYQGRGYFAKFKTKERLLHLYYYTLQIVPKEPKEKTNNDSVKLFFKLYLNELKVEKN